MYSAIIEGWNWAIVVAILIGGLIVIGAEVYGIFHHGDHQVDTISELYWQLRERMGPVRAFLAAALGIFFVWLWWHLSYEGKIRRADYKHHKGA